PRTFLISVSRAQLPASLLACIRVICVSCFFFSSRRRHTRSTRDWSSDVCSSDLGIPPGVSESRGKQRLLDGQFYSDAELMARETVALQLVVPNTTLIHVLASEPQPPVGGQREFETRLGDRKSVV